MALVAIVLVLTFAVYWLSIIFAVLIAILIPALVIGLFVWFVYEMVTDYENDTPESDSGFDR